MIYKTLELYLQERIRNLTGDWLKKPSHYEKQVCDILGFEFDSNRYWDAKFDGIKIELKKGIGHGWFDLVRYAEAYIQGGEAMEVLNLFLITDPRRTLVKEIIGIETQAITRILNPHRATQLIEFQKWAKELVRDLNAQARFQPDDLEKMAILIVRRNEQYSHSRLH
jgi:hypothetical protein